MIERIQHIVLFRFPRALSDDEEREMSAQVRAWPERIGGFTALRFGKNTSERSRGYSYALLVEFENSDAAASYFPHPVHRAFADWVHERGSEELVADYSLTDSTVIL